ncbi:hypothetical protein EJB05_13103 [Eragrostis curvula]|uniref:Uncharacterized protein n=1 Tax=Eragrostis curvula TaxID=38414 RepID=A0A5J9VVK2_9POAL|nr:hypothetical protein EJB05_13103 [Eragrostis curvula]
MTTRYSFFSSQIFMVFELLSALGFEQKDLVFCHGIVEIRACGIAISIFQGLFMLHSKKLKGNIKGVPKVISGKKKKNIGSKSK